MVQLRTRVSHAVDFMRSLALRVHRIANTALGLIRRSLVPPRHALALCVPQNRLHVRAARLARFGSVRCTQCGAEFLYGCTHAWHAWLGSRCAAVAIAAVAIERGMRAFDRPFFRWARVRDAAKTPAVFRTQCALLCGVVEVKRGSAHAGE